MGASEPVTETISASLVRQRWSEIINRVFRNETRVMIEKSGIPVAAIISADDFRRLQQLEAERAERFKILDEIGEAFKDVPPEEIEREVTRALSEARAANRQRQQEQQIARTA